MRLPLIGRARVKALHNTNPVPVIAEAAHPGNATALPPGWPPATGLDLERSVLPEPAPAEDVLEAADWIGYNKAGRPYDKRTGRLIKQGRM